MWVLEHKGITGNEKAGMLARKGADNPIMRPELSVGTSKNIRGKKSGYKKQ